MYEATESLGVSVPTGMREPFSFWKTNKLTMIVEERGIPVWTRVRLPPGPLIKNPSTIIFKSIVDGFAYFQDICSC